MNKSPPLAVAELLPRRIILIDILKQQMLDLEALCKEVAEAEKRYRCERLSSGARKSNVLPRGA